MSNIKRIMNDLGKLEESKHDDIFVHIDEHDIQIIYILFIGPKDTVFEGGFFYFKFNMHNFPRNPPKVTFLTPMSPTFRLHPNLYASGKTCLSILNTWGSNEWSPLLSLEKIIVTIQALLDNNPLANEPSFYTIKATSSKAIDYAIMSRYLTMKSIPDMLNRKDMPTEFQKVMRTYIDANFNIYEKSFDELDLYLGKKICTIHGIYTISNYKFSAEITKK